MKSRLLMFGLLLIFGVTGGTVSAERVAHSSSHTAKRRSVRRGKNIDYCKKIRPTVARMTGSKAGCYMKLFAHESSCNWQLPQKKGNAGNPYAAFGLCSIERSPAVREDNNRGPACRDISTLEGQINCCRSMMKKYSRSRSYFGPVRRHEVPKCE